MAKVLFEPDWITSPKVKHPLADSSSARAHVARHATGNSATVLAQITGWTQELMRLPDAELAAPLADPLAARFAVLDLLDAHAKNHQISLIPEYLETARLRKLTEGALWKTSFDFWKVMGDAYQACLKAYQSNPPQTSEHDYLLPILVGRILRSLALQIKWTLLRHERVEEKLWRDLGSAYLFAESRNFATRRVAVYASRHGESSAQTELLKVLMLTIAGPDALSPMHQHIAERIVAYFGDRFVLSTTPSTACRFAFDLVTGKAPARNEKLDGARLLARHFGPGDAAEGLLELMAFVHRHGKLPPYVNAGVPLERDQIEVVLRHLGRHWADSALPRQGERQQQTARMTIAPGLIEISHWLKKMMSAASAVDAQPQSAEHWQVSDASASGCGLMAPSQPSDWVAIGTLVGVHDENDFSFRLGIIRRIIRQGDAQHHVGVEYLGAAAAPVAIFPAAATHAADQDRPGEAAVLVSRGPDEHGTVELISRADGTSNAKALQMRLRSQVHQLEQVQVMEQSAGYRRARYRLL